MQDDDRERREPAKDDAPIVPQFDVRNCIVCGEPMQYHSCKYRCRKCGTMIDCSDPF